MLDWKVGDQVVCIADNWKKNLWVKQYPVKGCIYTIRDFTDYHHDDRIGLLLEEIINPLATLKTPAGDPVVLEPSFIYKRFKPVKKTNIDQFISMLGPDSKKKEKKPEKILEDA